MKDHPHLLFVDDEPRILRTLQRAFQGLAQVSVADSGARALEILRQQPVHVVISDHRMPQMTGVELLRQVRQMQPDALRILLTGFADQQNVLDSVNEGEIFRFIQKPWRLDHLRETVMEAAQIACMPADQADATLEERQSLVVTEAEPVLSDFLRAALTDRPVHWARSVPETLARFEEQPPAVWVVDLRQASGPAFDLLRAIKQYESEVVTLVITPFADTEQVIRCINEAQVFRVLPRPVSRNMLRRGVEGALLHHRRLCASGALRARHRVENTPVEAGLLQRLRHFLGRRMMGQGPGSA